MTSKDGWERVHAWNSSAQKEARREMGSWRISASKRNSMQAAGEAKVTNSVPVESRCCPRSSALSSRSLSPLSSRRRCRMASTLRSQGHRPKHRQKWSDTSIVGRNDTSEEEVEDDDVLLLLDEEEEEDGD